MDAIWFSSAHCAGTGNEFWHVFMPCLSLRPTYTPPFLSILALQPHRNEGIATTFQPERVTRRALRQPETPQHLASWPCSRTRWRKYSRTRKGAQLISRISNGWNFTLIHFLTQHQRFSVLMQTASCFHLLASCFSLIVFRFSLLGLCSSLSSLASRSLVRAWCSVLGASSLTTVLILARNS